MGRILQQRSSAVVQVGIPPVRSSLPIAGFAVLDLEKAGQVEVWGHRRGGFGAEPKAPDTCEVRQHKAPRVHLAVHFVVAADQADAVVV